MLCILAFDDGKISCFGMQELACCRILVSIAILGCWRSIHGLCFEERVHLLAVGTIAAFHLAYSDVFLESKKKQIGGYSLANVLFTSAHHC